MTRRRARPLVLALPLRGAVRALDPLVAYRELAPLPALRRHVACYWTISEPSGSVAPHRVLPDGCMDLLVRIEHDGSAHACIVGTMSTAIVAQVASTQAFVGVRFRPGEALAFADVSADDARDTAVSPIDAGLRDTEPLLEALSRGERLRVDVARALDDWLLPRLLRARACDRRVRFAVDRLRGSAGAARIAGLARELGLSERQLERAFRERVGLSPKGFARVVRLEALVARLDGWDARRGKPPLSAWSGLLGYADQAHLAREVRALAGVTPSALARERMSGFFKSDGAAGATP